MCVDCAGVLLSWGTLVLLIQTHSYTHTHTYTAKHTNKHTLAQTLLVLAIKCVYTMMSMFLALNYPSATTSKKKQEPCFRSGLLWGSITRRLCPFKLGRCQRMQEEEEGLCGAPADSQRLTGDGQSRWRGPSLQRQEPNVSLLTPSPCHLNNTASYIPASEYCLKLTVFDALFHYEGFVQELLTEEECEENLDLQGFT